MTNEKTPEPKRNKEPSEQALLTEYQTLQDDNSSSMTSFWTIAGIFIGISTALFAGLIYGVLANDRLFGVFVKMITEAVSGTEIWVLRIIMSLLAVVVLFVFWFLRLWMRRIGFRQQINYERMRDIEQELGMWHVWRVYGVDSYKDGKFDSSIKSFEEMLLNYRKPEWWKKWRTIPRYGKPNRSNYDAIFGALIFLWSLLIISVWLPIIAAFPMFIILMDFLLALGGTILVVYLTRAG